MQTITSFTGENRWLSNFYECSIFYDGVRYPTTEHAYQASKTLDIKVRKAIASFGLASHAMHVGRALVIRPDWEQVKLQVMLDVNRSKFEENVGLWMKLVDSGDLQLIEGNSHGDAFWGMVYDKDNNLAGENNLGKILMQIRSELRDKANDVLLVKRKDMSEIDFETLQAMYVNIRYKNGR